MEIYPYDPHSGEYLGVANADPSPLEPGKFLIPANATHVPPGTVRAGHVAQWNGSAWVEVIDLRGTEYWLPGDDAETDPRKVQEIGQGLPAGAVTTRPAHVPYPTLDVARSAMVGWIDEFLSEITGKVPGYERASWPSKAEAARAYQAGTARPDQTAMLAGEASVSERAIDEVADVIVARADQYEAIISHAAGLRVKLDNQLEAATAPTEYEAILLQGQEQAVALLKALTGAQP